MNTPERTYVGVAVAAVASIYVAVKVLGHTRTGKSQERSTAHTAEHSDSFELEKLEIERGKLAIENKKLEVEQTKAKWAAIASIVPLLAVIGTVAFGIWSARQQSEAAFQLEIAKGLIQARDTNQASYRLELYKKLFPNRGIEGMPSTESGDIIGGDIMDEYLKIIAERGLNPAQTAELWRLLFPKDVWARDQMQIDFFKRVDAKPTTQPK